MSSIPSREDFQKIDRIMQLLLEINNPVYGLYGGTGVGLRDDCGDETISLKLTDPWSRRSLHLAISVDVGTAIDLSMISGALKQLSWDDYPRENEILSLLEQLGLE